MEVVERLCWGCGQAVLIATDNPESWTPASPNPRFYCVTCYPLRPVVQLTCGTNGTCGGIDPIT